MTRHKGCQLWLLLLIAHFIVLCCQLVLQVVLIINHANHTSACVHTYKSPYCCFKSTLKAQLNYRCSISVRPYIMILVLSMLDISEFSITHKICVTHSPIKESPWFAHSQGSWSLPSFHSQDFSKHSFPFSWHISSCDTGLCPCPTLVKLCILHGPVHWERWMWKAWWGECWDILPVMLPVSCLWGNVSQEPVWAWCFAGLF